MKLVVEQFTLPFRGRGIVCPSPSIAPRDAKPVPVSRRTRSQAGSGRHAEKKGVTA